MRCLKVNVHHKDGNHCNALPIFFWCMDYGIMGTEMSPSVFMGFLLLADNCC